MQEQNCRVDSKIDQIFYRVRILYMEDDSGLGLLLQKRLERMACLVDVAGDGKEGLNMFEKGTYDVVITDYNMPTVNGLEVLRKLKDSVPVIILTGQGDEKVAVEAMKLGAADYLAKDVDGEYIEVLPSIIDRVLERQQLINERRQALAELQASEARYQAVVEDQTEVICRFVPGGQLTFANMAFCRYCGIRQSDIVFQNLASLLSKKTYQNMRPIFQAMTPKNPIAMGTDSIIMADGKVHWLQWSSRAIFDEKNKTKEFQLVGRDITELKRIEEALRASEEKNNALLNAIPDPMLRISRQGTCVDLRTRPDQVVNLSPDCIGKNITEFFPSDVATLLQSHIDTLFLEKTSQVFQFQLRQGNNISQQEVRLVFAGGNEVLAIMRDVTERTEIEQQLQYLSIHDNLTGLYNRAYFAEEMQRLESGRDTAVGIVVCDIDGLKIVNDNLGHSRGDELLRAASRVILQAFRGSDAVARIGGDEFAILLPNATREALEQACNRLRMLVEQYNKSKPELLLSISVGAAMRSGEVFDLAEVFQHADEAMYTDKLQRSKNVRNAIAQNLREFLERKEVCNKEHSERVKAIVCNFGKALGFAADSFTDLDLFAGYHDIGKVALPERILRSRQGISLEEYTVIKRHCEVGHRIAQSTPMLVSVADWILKHHEWWNGSGYPLGISGSEIPLECRMLAIVDAFDSMTRGRYSTAKSLEEALAELRSCAGTQFDPELVEIFAHMVAKGEEIGEFAS